MTAVFKPHEEFKRLDTDPSAGAAEVYSDLLSKCPVARVEVDEVPSEVSMWGAFGFKELTSVMRNFRGMSSTVRLDTNGNPAIIPLWADPPFHTGYRKALNPAFPPEVVSRFEGRIRELASEMTDELLAKGDADFIAEFANVYPTRILCRFLGVPESDWPIHLEFVIANDQESDGGLTDTSTPVSEEIYGRITPYILKTIADHRENPDDGLVTAFLNAKIGDRPLEEAEIVHLTFAMMLAGHATTTAAISNMMMRIATDQDLQDLLREDPSRIPDALEECLRIDAPQQALYRKCLKETELGGETIAEGDIVLTNMGSANVDPTHFESPEKFDIDRPNKTDHLSFGFGVHQCLGQHLARLDMRIALEELLERTARITVSGPVSRRKYPVYAVTELPLTFTPAAGQPS